MNEYFIAVDGKALGPFPVSELLAHGLQAESLVWADGMANWAKATEVAEVAALFKPVPPPLPKTELSVEDQEYISLNRLRKPAVETSSQAIAKPKRGMLGWAAVGVVVLGLILAIVLLNYCNSRERLAEGQRNDATALEMEKQERMKAEKDSAEQAEQARIEREREKADSLARVNRAKSYALEHIADLVTAKYNGNVAIDVLLGGIKGLTVTVKNESDYLMDQVWVDVQYLKANGDVYKTSTLHFTHLEAGAEKTTDAPDSDRGTEVKVRVSGYVSRSLELNRPPQ